MPEPLYLLTGASGFLGNNLLLKLLEQQRRVRVLLRPAARARVQIPDAVEVILGDIVDAPSLERFFDAPEGTPLIVLHCASVVTFDPGYDARVYAANVQGVRNILEQCRRHPGTRLIYVSSTSAIPELPAPQTHAEVTRFDPALVRGYYAKTKAEATGLVLDAARAGEINASVVFPSGIFGPHDHAFGLVSGFLTAYVHGRIPAGLPGSFNMVDVRDLADGILSCAERGRAGEGYILAGEVLSFRALLDAFHACTGARRVRLIVPDPLATLAALCAEGYCKLLRKKPLLTRFLLYNLRRNNRYSSEKAASELGFRVRPVEQTIRDTVNWLKAEGRL